MRNQLKILAAIMAALLLGCAGCENSNTPSSASPSLATDAGGFGVGDVLPDFSVPTAEGGVFTLSDHLGKPVFINLFATWCGPCVREMPEIAKLYDAHSSEVTFIIIDVGEDMRTVQSFVSDNGYSMPFACAEDGAPFGSGYYVEYIPQTFVLSANGAIVEFIGGSADYEGFEAAIEAAMAQ